MEKFYIAVICGIHQVGSACIQKLINFFGNAKTAWAADRGELAKAGIKLNSLESLLTFRKKNPNAPDKLMEYCNEKKIGLCCISDDDYPQSLKEISLPPPVLYYRGKFEPSAKRLAMVGTRENSPYGRKIAAEIAEELSAQGFSIVSGAARGIDTFSHIGAMKNGRTVAVLGYGLNYIADAANKNLIDEIAENGAVISDFKLTQHPTKDTFRSRNRIIAGLSSGVVVIESAEKGGTLITCDYASKFGRKIFAVPGNIDSPQSAGCNNLIRNGAVLIRNADDILNFIRSDTNAEKS